MSGNLGSAIGGIAGGMIGGPGGAMIGSSLGGMLDKKKSSGGVNMPSYTEPTPYNYNTPYGNAIFKDGSWQYQDVGTGAEDRNTITAMRNAILKTIGVTGAEREASLKNWSDTFFKEAQRTSQPALEQSLFARGLGGSRFYQNSLTDLLSKIGTQATLNAENLRSTDEATKLNQLGSLSNLLSGDQSNILNLLNLASGTQSNRAGTAANIYQSQLPYTTTYSGGQDNGLGSLMGTLAPFASSMFGGGAGGGGSLSSLTSSFGGGAGAFNAPSSGFLSNIGNQAGYTMSVR